MINPTTGANVSRTFSDQRSDVQAVFGFTTTAEQDSPILLVNSELTPAAGSYAITDRDIIIDGDNASLIASTQGCHVSFYNCRIIVTTWDIIGGNGVVLSVPIGTFSSAGNAGGGFGGRETPTNFTNPTTGRSMNAYGCTVHIAESEARHSNIFGNFGDFIGSDITFGGLSTRPTGMAVNFTYQTGGRFINSTHICNPQVTSLESMQGYSFSDVFEGARIYSCGMTSGNADTAGSAGSGPRLLVETQFTYDDQTNFFTIQGDNRSGWNQAANAFLQLGFRTPPSNSSRGGTIGNNNFGNSATDYLGIVNGAGSVYNFAGYQPTYRDLATGNPIQNVRVRVATSALRGSATPTAASNWHSQITADNTEKTLGTNFYANEYLTDATGQLVTSRSTQNGWTSASSGSYDPFRFEARTATGSSQLASLDLDTIVLNAPEHCAPVLLQHLKGTVSGTGAANAGFTRHQARYQARSYTHNVSEDFTESSTTLPDGSARGTRTDYGIDRTVRNELARPVVISTTEAAALSSFGSLTQRTAQGIYEFILAHWVTYDSDDEPTVSGDTFTWPGGVITLSDTDQISTVIEEIAVINRVSELVAGDNISNISVGGNISIGTTVTGVNLTSAGTIGFTGNPTITDSILTATSFNNFPTTLDGSITFNGIFEFESGTNNLIVTDSSNLSGLTLDVADGATLNVIGAIESDFAAVTGDGTANFLFVTTVNADISNGLISIRKADGTYLHQSGSASVNYSSAQLPVGTHRAVLTAKGRSGTPIEFTVSGTGSIDLTSTDLTMFGYNTSTNIGTSRTYTKATFDSRPVVRTIEIGKNNYYIDPLETSRWFGDLYGEQTTNEVILDNFAMTSDTEMFTLNPGSNVTAINLPLVQAYHGIGVDGVLTFSANDENAKAIDSDYEMTDAINTTINVPAGQGVNSTPNSIGGLNSVIVFETTRSIEAINTNTDAEIAAITSHVTTATDGVNSHTDTVCRRSKR